MKNIPNKIFLQIGEEKPKDFNDLRDVTWSEDKIFDSDISYIQAQWFDVCDKLPEINKKVLILTKNKKVNISAMYIPVDCKGNVLGHKRWKGSSFFEDSIIAWMYIPKYK